jgi:4-hydroxybenzoate polyprenyltransferase
MILKYLQLIRVHQWIKNFFVFVPLLFSLHLFEGNYFLKSLFAFFIFCLSSSAIYVINDLVDVEADRVHPIKKNRPLPSGEILQSTAVIIASLLIVVQLF